MVFIEKKPNVPVDWSVYKGKGIALRKRIGI